MFPAQDLDVQAVVKEGALDLLEPKHLLGDLVANIVTSELAPILEFFVVFAVDIQANLVPVGRKATPTKL